MSRSDPLEWWFKQASPGHRDGGDHGITVEAIAATGFAVAPGRRCEPAATQYASVVSDEHLIRCHGSLVDLLDEAVRLGIGVTVRDETHYWPTRDIGRLVQEVHNMNRIVAKLAGRLGDALGDDLRVGGAITEHRRFEDLEME